MKGHCAGCLDLGIATDVANEAAGGSSISGAATERGGQRRHTSNSCGNGGSTQLQTVRDGQNGVREEVKQVRRQWRGIRGFVLWLTCQKEEPARSLTVNMHITSSKRGSRQEA